MMIAAFVMLISLTHECDYKQKIAFKLYKQLREENPSIWSYEPPLALFQPIVVTRKRDYIYDKSYYVIRRRDQLRAWFYLKKVYRVPCVKTRQEWDKIYGGK